MYTPNPIIFGPLPTGGVTLTLGGERGGLAGYILTGQSGSPATVTLNGAPVTYPVTLQAGDTLHLTRGAGNALSQIHALAPLDETETLNVTTDADGYLSSDDPRIVTNPDGYLGAPDELVTVGSDGYLSEV